MEGRVHRQEVKNERSGERRLFVYMRVGEGKGEKEVQSREICTVERIEIASSAGAKLQHRNATDYEREQER